MISSKVLWKTLFLLVTLGAIACATGDPDYDPEYHQNLFYTGFSEAPTHGKKAHVDFFDKECSASGSGSGNQSGDFSCHYTDQ